MKSWGKKAMAKVVVNIFFFFITLSDLAERVFASDSKHEEYSFIQ